MARKAAIFSIYDLAGNLVIKGTASECASCIGSNEKQIMNNIYASSTTILGKYIAFTEQEDEDAEEAMVRERLIVVNNPEWSAQEVLNYCAIYGTERALIEYMDRHRIHEFTADYILEKIAVIMKLAADFGREQQKRIINENRKMLDDK